MVLAVTISIILLTTAATNSMCGTPVDINLEEEKTAEEKPEVAATVHYGSVEKLIRNVTLKKGSGDNHVEDTHRVRNDHDPERVVHPQIPYQKKQWNESAGEKHRKCQNTHQ